MEQLNDAISADIEEVKAKVDAQAVPIVSKAKKMRKKVKINMSQFKRTSVIPTAAAVATSAATNDEQED